MQMLGATPQRAAQSVDLSCTGKSVDVQPSFQAIPVPAGISSKVARAVSSAGQQPDQGVQQQGGAHVQQMMQVSANSACSQGGYDQRGPHQTSAMQPQQRGAATPQRAARSVDLSATGKSVDVQPAIQAIPIPLGTSQKVTPVLSTGQQPEQGAQQQAVPYLQERAVSRPWMQASTTPGREQRGQHQAAAMQLQQADHKIDHGSIQQHATPSKGESAEVHFLIQAAPAMSGSLNVNAAATAVLPAGQQQHQAAATK